jgi:hypothetical protein
MSLQQQTILSIHIHLTELMLLFVEIRKSIFTVSTHQFQTLIAQNKRLNRQGRYFFVSIHLRDRVIDILNSTINHLKNLKFYAKKNPSQF